MDARLHPYRDVFPQYLKEYLELIREGSRRTPSMHHDQRRHLFVDFLRKGLDIEPAEVELEQKIRVAEVRGRIDALCRSLIIEFKSDLEAELPAALSELGKYFKSRSHPEEYIALVTDGISFRAFRFVGSKPRQFAEFTLSDSDALAAFRSLDQYIFSAPPVTPKSEDITSRFGLHSAVFASSFERLTEIYDAVRKVPSVRGKFREWDALLSRVYGSSIGDEDLFLKHSYLTVLSRLLVAKAIAPATERKTSDYSGLMTGEFFRSRNLANLAESDFFSWPLETTQEKSFIGLMARLEAYLRVYDLRQITEDILKEIYQELVDPESRHQLGEYYTPDWLADLTLEILKYKTGRLLDPACGSGSFLLAAVRRKKAEGLKGKALLDYTLDSIIGIDVHPLAVLMTKANLILAMIDEIQKARIDINLPVYMADTLLVDEDPKGERIKIHVTDREEFNIPLSTIQRLESVDPLIDAITKAARLAAGSVKKTQSALTGLQKHELANLSESEQFFWSQNFKLLARLIGEGRDTVFGYVLKNAYRPAYIRQRKVDYVVGNPPWLSYRFIQDKGYRARIKQLIFDLGLLGRKEVKLFTQMDTSTLFFAYCEKEFLKPEGVIAFVLPKTTVLAAKQHAAFQARGASEIHDFTDVSPLFNVRSVLIVRRPGEHLTEGVPSTFYRGVLPRKNLTLRAARATLTTERGAYTFLADRVHSEYYYPRFLQGATIVPRSMWFVQPKKGSPKRAAAPYVETSDEAYEEAKAGWKLRLEGRIEAQFLFGTVLAKGLLPFFISRIETVFLPVRVLSESIVIADSAALLEHGARYAAEWMSHAEEEWDKARRDKDDTPLHAWLNYTQKLVKQLPDNRYVVLYNTSGTNLSAALLDTEELLPTPLAIRGFFADAKTYYYYPESRAEGDYLVAVLNSDPVNTAIKEFQPEGLYGERDIHRRPFEVCAIPRFDRDESLHMELVRLGRVASKLVAKHSLALTGTLARRRGSSRLLIADELSQIDKLVGSLLEAQPARSMSRTSRKGSGQTLLLFQ